MSNIYKSVLYNLLNNEEVRVIDNNAIISEKLEEIKSRLEQNSNEFHEDGFTPGLNPAEVETMSDGQMEHAAALERASETADEIIAKATREAERLLQKAESDAMTILQNANEEREQTLKNASEEGQRQGYQEGLEQSRRELQVKEEELAARQTQMEADVEKERSEMEPKLVEAILDVFSEMVQVLSIDKKDLILSVVNRALENVDVGKNYLIRVCPQEAAFLRENKEKIETGLADVDVEIVEDMTMKRGQCMIDTEMGIFDCSLDMQLEELIEDIRILSCSGRTA